MSEGKERYGFETFDCAPALRLESREKVSAVHYAGLNRRLDRLEAMMEPPAV